MQMQQEKSYIVTIKSRALAALAPPPQLPPATMYSAGIHGFECMWEACCQVLLCKGVCAMFGKT